MPIVVEDGTGKINSNSYVTLDEVDVYHEERNNTEWASLDDTAKEASLIKAATYIDSFSFRGVRYSGGQAMAFPRESLVDNDGYELSYYSIPIRLKYAQMEAALREAVTPGILQPDLERGGGIKRKKVDVLETEYFEGASGATVLTIINNLLRGLLKSSSTMEIVRR